jgi:hypothetical protein
LTAFGLGASEVYLIVTHSEWNTSTKTLGESKEYAFQDLEEKQSLIHQAAVRWDLDPRVLGSSICAERMHNYIPYLEPISDAFFGTTFGFAQVSPRSFQEALDTIDGIVRSRGVSSDELTRLNESLGYFRPYQRLSYSELKWTLMSNDEVNINVAAVILKGKLIRYRRSKGGIDARDRPDIAATLYHSRFPSQIRGTPDSLGIAAMTLYNDSSFMKQTGFLVRCHK